MNELQTSLPVTLASSELSPAAARRGMTMLRTCLVVSESAHRAKRFVEAAQQEQWSTIVCGNADEAARNAVRQRIQLALIDLESVREAQQSALCKLTEQLVGGPLLVVCGRPNDDAGEVWSRGLGVWMYLPGINSQTDIGLVYGQARRVVEKLENGAPQLAHQSNGMNGTNGISRGGRRAAEAAHRSLPET
jgi:hypothetical protein